jgi:hypothetical protein
MSENQVVGRCKSYVLSVLKDCNVREVASNYAGCTIGRCVIDIEYYAGGYLVQDRLQTSANPFCFIAAHYNDRCTLFGLYTAADIGKLWIQLRSFLRTELGSMRILAPDLQDAYLVAAYAAVAATSSTRPRRS